MKATRTVIVGGDVFVVPTYIYRAKAGWQARIDREWRSIYVSDGNRGTAASLEDAKQALETLRREKEHADTLRQRKLSSALQILRYTTPVETWLKN